MPVTVFDKETRWAACWPGHPSFRLEKNVVNAEIDILKEMGVEFKCGVEVGKDVTIRRAAQEGYKGFYLAIGAQKSAPINVPRRGSQGRVGAAWTSCARSIWARSPRSARSVAVIGGGNVAMDVCRSAVRLGAEDTYIVYRRSEDEMPADPDEVAEAMAEGVEFRFLNAPPPRSPAPPTARSTA
jgi:NADPH-dependent glutamate synthase beta subunit-like oxidoreductase